MAGQRQAEVQVEKPNVAQQQLEDGHAEALGWAVRRATEGEGQRSRGEAALPQEGAGHQAAAADLCGQLDASNVKTSWWEKSLQAEVGRHM